MPSSAPFPSSEAKPLEALDALILNNRGALYEGDIFSILKQSPFVVRSFEFALADGALNCAGEVTPEVSFADRFWDVDQSLRQNPMSTKLLLFDVKSKVSQHAGDQTYITTIGQRRRVAFYIGICAADPSFVDLIPNFHQEAPSASAVSNEEDDREVAVNTSRVSRLPPSAYKLDPCNAPYRIPLPLLLEAVRRVRCCALDKGPYINPWTLVPFPQWKPWTTRSNQSLRPSESSEHFTAYQATMEIYRLVNKVQVVHYPLELDFVGVQPRLADFKLVTSVRQSTEFKAPHRRRQIFVQHKLDGRDRARSTPLANVAIARGQGKKRRWYFSDMDRFDFLFYQFSFSNRPDPQPRVEFFFIPEWEIPDIFYETLSVEESFERLNFAKYRIVMERNGDWVRRMLQVILENPQPRQAAPRPPRPAYIQDALDTTTLSVDSTAHVSESYVPAAQQSHGRHLYKEIMTHSHRQFYDNVMRQCAERRSGLLFLFATEHPVGDFGFCRYKWKPQEQQDFFNSPSNPPPKTIDQLPANVPGVPISYYTRDLECTFTGPNLTAPQSRRLNSCQEHRLIIWNLAGPDELGPSGPLIVIPSEDLCPTNAQRELFASNLRKKKTEEFTDRMPVISAVLNTGLFAAEYGVGKMGPLVYDGDAWGEIWQLLNDFTKPSPLQHPEGYVRDTASFRHPLWKLHMRLTQEHA